MSDEDLKVEDDEIIVPADEIDGGEAQKAAELEKAEGKEPEKSAAEGIEDLKRQLEVEKLARVQSERQARERAEEAGRYRSAAEQTRADNLANAVDLATQEMDRQKMAYRAALEAGDFNAAAEAQEAMSTAAAAKAMAAQARATYDAQMRVRAAQPARQEVQYTPATQDWINKHPEFNTNEGFRKRAFAAHELASGEGHQTDTPEYFARIEALMGLRQAEAQPSPVVERAARPDPGVAAPVRGAAAASPSADGGRKVYHLSKEEREMADMCGIPYAEYARNRESLKAAG